MWSGTHSPGQIAVWDPSGSLRAAFGTYGEGPGEFKGTGYFSFFEKGDSVLVRDNTARFSVLLGDGRFVRRGHQDGFGLQSQLAHLGGGEFLETRSSSIIRRTIDDVVADPWATLDGPPSSLGHPIAVGPDGEAWVSNRTDLVLQRFDARGSRAESFVPEGTRFERTDPASRYGSYVSKIQFHDGLIWVWSFVADPELAESPTRAPDQRNALPIVEVVDPATRRVVFSADLDSERMFLGFLREDLAMFLGQDDLGFQRTELVHARLVDAGGGAASR